MRVSGVIDMLLEARDGGGGGVAHVDAGGLVGALAFAAGGAGDHGVDDAATVVSGSARCWSWAS